MEDQIAVARWKTIWTFWRFNFDNIWTGNLWKRHPTWIQPGAFVIIVVVCNLGSRQLTGLLSGDGHMEDLQPPSPSSKVAILSKSKSILHFCFLQIIQTVLSSLVEYQVLFLEKNYRYHLFDSFSNLIYIIFHMEYEIMTRHTKRIQIVANSCPCQ